MGVNNSPPSILFGPNNNANNLEANIINANGQQLQFNGQKNYLNNPGAELGTTLGFSLGTVTLTSNLPTGTPTFGSGASGNLALTATSTTPLSGVYSFSYASSAATTAGNFIASDAFTVDSADLGKVLNVQFYYKATSNPGNANWSGTVSNSFSIAIYDVTAGAANWIIPVGNQSMIQSANTGVATASFQSSVVSGQQYRIVVYNANATAGAITLYFDQLFAGPAGIAAPSSVIAWNGSNASQAITANVTNLAATTNYDSSAAWNGTQYVVPSSGTYIIAAGFSASGAVTIQPYLNGSVYLTTAKFATASASTDGSGACIMTNLKAGDLISLRGAQSVTITSLTMGVAQFGGASVGPAGQVIAARAHVSSGASTTAGNPVNFDTVEFDTTGSITVGTTTWKYTAPVSGNYYVSTGYYGGSTGCDVLLYKNSAKFCYILNTNPTSVYGAGSTLVPMNAGDTLFISPQATSTPSATSNTTVAQTNFVNVFLVQGPSSQQSAPSINARYHGSSTTITSSLATIVWSTKDFDTNAAMNAGTGVYTVPTTGKYQVNCAIITAGTFSLNNSIDLQIQKNGTPWTEQTMFAFASATDISVTVGDIIQCNAGDTIQVQLSSSAVTPSISASNTKNWFSIALVGN